jgi:hypothetical protein
VLPRSGLAPGTTIWAARSKAQTGAISDSNWRWPRRRAQRRPVRRAVSRDLLRSQGLHDVDSGGAGGRQH